MFLFGAGIYLVAGMVVIAGAYFAIDAWLSRPGSSQLLITPEGLTVKFKGGRSFFKWTEIKRFGVAEYLVIKHGWYRAVGIRFKSRKRSFQGNWHGVSPKKRIRTGGFDAVLFSSYGRDCAELVPHLNEERERWVEWV